jgi:hypothetical protein
MCCFSGKVQAVAGTRIFARSAAKGRQFLVYAMSFSAADDLSMILPLPVPEKTGDDAVRFIDLKAYPTFFDAMEKGFHPPPSGGEPKPAPMARSAPTPVPLKVVDVGDFEASFVPTIKDFSRLDERFRLPDGTWDALPDYKTYGFAVFKLKKGNRAVHPMAFEFPASEPRRLFFPTVHIHDGKVHPKADFDHILYGQVGEGEISAVKQWKESPLTAAQFMKMEKCQGVVDGGGHCYRFEIQGAYKNQDYML